MTPYIRVLLIALLLPLPCFAQLREENLLVNLPNGYKIDHQDRRGNMLLTEMVPQAESVKNWTEMLTTQIFFGMKNTTPEQFQASVQKGWLSSCKNGGFAAITSGHENGYAFALWVLTCPLNPRTGKPENTWFKAIKGNDSFYVVQKAFRFDPTKQQVTEWVQFMRKVAVCDTRLAERPCPNFEGSKR